MQIELLVNTQVLNVNKISKSNGNLNFSRCISEEEKWLEIICKFISPGIITRTLRKQTSSKSRKHMPHMIQQKGAEEVRNNRRSKHITEDHRVK